MFKKPGVKVEDTTPIENSRSSLTFTEMNFRLLTDEIPFIEF